MAGRHDSALFLGPVENIPTTHRRSLVVNIRSRTPIRVMRLNWNMSGITQNHRILAG